MYHFWSILSQSRKLLLKYFLIALPIIYPTLLLMHPPPPTLYLCTCAISKASSSCPLPVKKVTSFFMSPVAMQYGIASSLSSAISWSARLKHRHVKIKCTAQIILWCFVCYKHFDAHSKFQVLHRIYTQTRALPKTTWSKQMVDTIKATILHNANQNNECIINSSICEEKSIFFGYCVKWNFVSAQRLIVLKTEFIMLDYMIGLVFLIFCSLWLQKSP